MHRFQAKNYFFSGDCALPPPQTNPTGRGIPHPRPHSPRIFKHAKFVQYYCHRLLAVDFKYTSMSYLFFCHFVEAFLFREDIYTYRQRYYDSRPM